MLTTLSLTLPRINLSKPDLPELPITIKSISSSSATSSIVFAGEPSLITDDIFSGIEMLDGILRKMYEDEFKEDFSGS